jgi:hypothetical protein
MTNIHPSLPEAEIPSGLPARPLLRRDQVTVYLRDTWGIQRTVSTLAKLAVVGGGPPFHKDGRWPLYDPTQVDQWVRDRLGTARGSTSAGQP